MRRWINKIASLVTVFSVIGSAVSCSGDYDFGFKDLCFYHPHTAPVVVGVDWSEFEPLVNVNEDLSGMSIYVWKQNSDEKPLSFKTHDLSSITLDLKPGLFNAFVFNLTPEEFGSFEFCNMDQYELAEARIVDSKLPVITSKIPTTKVVTDPEWFALDRIEDIEVTQEMVEIAEEEFLENFNSTSPYGRSVSTKTQNHVGTLVPKSIIKQIALEINLTNYKSLRTPLGYLEGLADGCYLASGLTTDRKITHNITFTELKSKVDAQTQEKDQVEAVLYATITTFGNPQGHTGLPTDNVLVLEFTLRNGEVESLSFDVGDQLADLNTYDGTIKDETGHPIWPKVFLDVELPFIEVSDGIFDIGVGEWGPENETTLPLN